MNTAYLENFIAIAEERNISAAARRMHIAQSALSTQLKSLEEEMGCMLLKRSSHGVSLSFEGELFYRYARRMLALERELPGPAGRLRRRQRRHFKAGGKLGMSGLGAGRPAAPLWP